MSALRPGTYCCTLDAYTITRLNIKHVVTIDVMTFSAKAEGLCAVDVYFAFVYTMFYLLFLNKGFDKECSISLIIYLMLYC